MSNYFPTVLDPIAEAKRQWTVHGWEAAAPGMAAVTTIVRVNQIVMSEVEATLAPLGLSFARFEILRLLGFSRQGQLPMGKIGQRLQVHPASVTSAVKRLERDRLVKRQGHPDDNRVIMAGILPRGRSRLADATERINAVFEDLSMSAEDLDRLTELLNHLRARAGDPVALWNHLGTTPLPASPALPPTLTSFAGGSNSTDPFSPQEARRADVGGSTPKGGGGHHASGGMSGP